MYVPVKKPRRAPLPDPLKNHEVQNLSTLQSHVKRINKIAIPVDKLKMYEDLYENLSKRLKFVDLVPSKMQFATAIAAYLNIETELKQVWSQPSGTGKTRTLMSLVWILTVVGDYKHITVRCPSLLLLE